MDAGEHRVLGGRYRVGPPLGQGGTACVYDGYDTRLARPVAIKQLRPEVAADVAMRRRFEQEARTAAQLTHPNAVAVYDTGEEAGQTFLVMERLPGRSLADRIREGPLGPEEAVGVATDVLAALRAAHSLGSVHRDVKPGNILLTEEGRAKVADFGIAKSLDLVPTGDTATADTTAFGLVVGTPAYLAPERLSGHPATERADLYALGVVLYEALTGAKPELGATAVPGAPPELAGVVVRALSPRPAGRFASAAEMAAALGAAIKTPIADAYNVRIVSVMDKAEHISESYVLRLFRSHPMVRFEGKVHEQVFQALTRQKMAVAPLNIPPAHKGILDAEFAERDKNKGKRTLFDKNLQEHPECEHLRWTLAETAVVDSDFHA